MPGYHKKKNKQKKAHHNGEPHDHPHKKKEDLKKRLAKISKKVPQDPTLKHQRHIMLHHGRPMVNYDKELIDKTVLKNQKKGKKVPQDKIRETPTKENNYQTHMDSKGAFEQRALKEKVKKSKKYKTHAERDTEKHGEGLYEMMDRFGEIDKKKPKQKKEEKTDEKEQQKKKRKDKEKLIHQARGMGVIPTYGKSKVKKTPPQGPSGGTADNPDDIIKDAEAVARKNDTYIGQLKQKIAEKRKKDYQQFKLKEEEEEEIARENSKKTAQEHDHSITFKGYKGESYKRASLISNTGKYAKYWLLNAKQTNGNGWGVSQQSIAKNIHKFVGKPLVVTAKSWIPDSEYGDAYEHPYLPTNDISKVFDHQEKFRVGSIVDIIEKDGDYFANIELNQKFAHMVMPPFCSPAIFQNNPSEPEGQISDWEALHLAALHEDPAYGSRIALLRGTCVGTKDQCTVQFKSAKQEAKMVCTKGLKGRIARVKKNEKTSDQAIDDVIKDIKDPDLREDAETRHHHTRPKRLYNHNRKAKLKQRIAAIEQQKLAVSYKRKIDEVMKSFNTWEYKNEKTPKGLKKKDDRFEPLFTKHKGGIRGVRHLGNKFQYSGHYKGTGTTIPKGAKDKFTPHIIMEKTPKGIIIDNYGYDSGSTYRYFNKAGISTERKGDKMYIGGKPYNFEQGGKMLIPYKNITAPLAPKKRYVGHVRPRQHEMSQQTRLDATGDIKGVPEDPTRIQPKDQRLINKITGVKSKVPRRKILGTESHHLFEYGKYPQMDKLEHAGIGVSHRTHQEIMNPRKFTAKLKPRLSKILNKKE